ncbi:MAG: DUF1338 domain-containing protein [Glaciimonas sp.]|nr:DUF1338 domain-containing protein [Glaciimonas sp.]
MNTLESLLNAYLGHAATSHMLQLMHIPQKFTDATHNKDAVNKNTATRTEIAYALNVILFRDLLERVPEGKAYTEDAMHSGRKVFFDHGAVRTVHLPKSGQLPIGETSITRFLAPLGYQLNEIYPLPRLKMTGRAYFHADLPEHMPQFFVSELHVDQFSPAFQDAAARVVADSHDPIDATALTHLQQLQDTHTLSFDAAVFLLHALVRCFARQHATPALSDYEILLQESQEMAWISTEGNAFNHVTDRVPDLTALAEEQKNLGRSIKPNIEVAARGTMRQTAYRAAEVERVFRTPKGCVVRRVPGSFYEFISRDLIQDAQGEKALDLKFDSSNATAIFKMTSTENALQKSS